MISLNKELVRKISLELREQIIGKGYADSVEVDGLSFVFSAKVSDEPERMTTGVEFLGDAETYVKSNLLVRRLRLEGVYDADGNEVETDLDPNDIEIDYDDETVSVTLVSVWKERKASTIPLPVRGLPASVPAA